MSVEKGVSFPMICQRILNSDPWLLNSDSCSWLKAETESAAHCVRAVMIAGNLSIITNGGPDSGSDLDALTRRRRYSRNRPSH